MITCSDGLLLSREDLYTAGIETLCIFYCELTCLISHLNRSGSLSDLVSRVVAVNGDELLSKCNPRRTKPLFVIRCWVSRLTARDSITASVARQQTQSSRYIMSMSAQYIIGIFKYLTLRLVFIYYFQNNFIRIVSGSKTIKLLQMEKKSQHFLSLWLITWSKIKVLTSAII